jgi:HAD superfamily hydrolase (TIGR01509 family)
MTPPAAFRGVILDMDGVLVDSAPFTVAAAVRMFAEWGVTVHPEDFRPHFGSGEANMIGAVAGRYGVAIDPDRAKARTYELYLQSIPGRLAALPGVRPFIAACREAGLRLAVASSADAVKVEGNLLAVGLPQSGFDAVLTGCDAARKKPAPDLFLLAADRLGLPPADCLVVEDAIVGVAAAKGAGAWCLALTTSFPAERLTQADWVAPDLSAPPAEVLSRLGRRAAG